MNIVSMTGEFMAFTSSIFHFFLREAAKSFFSGPVKAGPLFEARKKNQKKKFGH